ncbi:TolC family protein [Mucilaginibacter lacusdianchii]|uniref:TolC family protein n=1 Tax=Mucilaginibacter lacusdianchii TaxID=2684211 RepID=UPI00131D324D|nr:TolC family protein [Mucilaginibacter sp. JXJ CY 39]
MKLKLIAYGLISCLLFFLSKGSAIAQAQNNKVSDSSKVFALQDLQEFVFKNHPIVKQAALLSDAARANVLQSLGYFDPALKAAFGRKLFGHSEYYNHWTSELKVPLWLAGADLKIGYDRNVGEYTNPETHTSLSGLTGIGLSIPLGQGLIIDSRRSTLRQSKIMVGYAEAERIKQINAVWYNAVKDYWNWYYAYRQYQLINEGVRLAQQRYLAVSGQTLLGDKPGIDSVEANITVQDRRIQLEKVKIELQNARLVLSNHLWSDKDTPLELPVDAVPQLAAASKVDRQVVDTLIRQAADQHPELVKLRAKSGQLAIERSYRREMLKPKINVTGSLLSKRRSFDTYVPDYYDFGWSNYKVGLEFSFPLFLRAERGKLREVKIKQEQLDYDLQQSGRVIQNDVMTSYNDLKAYESQLAIQIKNIDYQQVLLKGESQKFDLGESTLFLINSRESKLIDMQVKREEMIAGFQKALAGLYYKAGTRQNQD